MESTLSESEAVRQARSGNSAAYAVLAGLYQEVAFRAAYLIVRDAAAAEDVVQEAFVRAHRELGRFREGEPFRPWLLRIVSNLALNEVRSRGRKLGLLHWGLVCSMRRAAGSWRGRTRHYRDASFSLDGRYLHAITRSPELEVVATYAEPMRARMLVGISRW